MDLWQVTLYVLLTTLESLVKDSTESERQDTLSAQNKVTWEFKMTYKNSGWLMALEGPGLRQVTLCVWRRIMGW